MFQLQIRNAKPLFALSTLLVPWDVFAFGRNLGWGLHFALIRFTDAKAGFGAQYQTADLMFRLTDAVDAGERLGIYVWILTGTLATLTAAYVVLARVLNGTTRPAEDRVVGAVFLGAGSLFIVSRFFMYEYLLVSPQTHARWFSVPVGALYVIFVGYVFYRRRFRLGA